MLCSDPRISDGYVSYDDRHLSLPAPSAGSSPLIQGLGAWSDGQSPVEPFPELSGVAAADGALSEISDFSRLMDVSFVQCTATEFLAKHRLPDAPACCRHSCLKSASVRGQRVTGVFRVRFSFAVQFWFPAMTSFNFLYRLPPLWQLPLVVGSSLLPHALHTCSRAVPVGPLQVLPCVVPS